MICLYSSDSVGKICGANGRAAARTTLRRGQEMSVMEDSGAAAFSCSRQLALHRPSQRPDMCITQSACRIQCSYMFIHWSQIPAQVDFPLFAKLSASVLPLVRSNVNDSVRLLCSSAENLSLPCFHLACNMCKHRIHHSKLSSPCVHVKLTCFCKRFVFAALWCLIFARLLQGLLVSESIHFPTSIRS